MYAMNWLLIKLSLLITCMHYPNKRHNRTIRLCTYSINACVCILEEVYGLNWSLLSLYLRFKSILIVKLESLYGYFQAKVWIIRIASVHREHWHT